MSATVQVRCRCGTMFTARKADRARGWGKFCSKRCKAIEQEKRTGQYAGMIANGSDLANGNDPKDAMYLDPSDDDYWRDKGE